MANPAPLPRQLPRCRNATDADYDEAAVEEDVAVDDVWILPVEFAEAHESYELSLPSSQSQVAVVVV